MDQAWCRGCVGSETRGAAEAGRITRRHVRQTPEHRTGGLTGTASTQGMVQHQRPPVVDAVSRCAPLRKSSALLYRPRRVCCREPRVARGRFPKERRPRRVLAPRAPPDAGARVKSACRSRGPRSARSAPPWKKSVRRMPRAPITAARRVAKHAEQPCPIRPTLSAAAVPRPRVVAAAAVCRGAERDGGAPMVVGAGERAHRRQDARGDVVDKPRLRRRGDPRALCCRAPAASARPAAVRAARAEPEAAAAAPATTRAARGRTRLGCMVYSRSPRSRVPSCGSVGVEYLRNAVDHDDGIARQHRIGGKGKIRRRAQKHSARAYRAAAWADDARPRERATSEILWSRPRTT